MQERNPLSTLNGNTLFAPTSSSTSTSTPQSTRTPASSTKAKKLAPIFTRDYSRCRPSTPASSSSISARERDARDEEHARKRARVDRDRDREDLVLTDTEDPRDVDTGSRGRVSSMKEYFVTVPPRIEHYAESGKPSHSVVQQQVSSGSWTRRGRMGNGLGRRMLMSSGHRSVAPVTPYLDTLVTRLSDYPTAPPSLLLISSLHPWLHPRDFAPPLSVRFSHSARDHSASSAAAYGARRLLAVAAEEGGVRVVDVDQGLGHDRDSEGWFWRAHGNAVLDLKWSADDSRILTGSGDATARLHAMDAPTPTLIASLTGHTASLKSVTFFDPTRGAVDPSISSSVIATTGRDGNILIYDIRMPGNTMLSGSGNVPRRSTRPRYSQGVPGFAPQEGGDIAPVMEIRNAHDPNRKKTVRSVSSLVALQSMPGVLASAAAHEGVVKLWDPRFNSRAMAQPSASLPDPTAQDNSKRPRGVHAMVEQPSTGDLHVLTGDSKVHVLRPSAGLSEPSESILPVRYTHAMLHTTYWMGLSFSPCGRYLASGSSKGGLMTWDTDAPVFGPSGVREVHATRLGLGARNQNAKEREVSAVDWGHDMVAGCSDDYATRIWRSDVGMAGRMGDACVAAEWAGRCSE